MSCTSDNRSCSSRILQDIIPSYKGYLTWYRKVWQQHRICFNHCQNLHGSKSTPSWGDKFWDAQMMTFWLYWSKSAANYVCLICGIIWPCCELFLVVLANHYFLQGLVRQKITFPLLHQSSLSRYINKNRIFQIDGMWFSHCFCSLKSGLNLKMDNSEKICSD